jgi:hypothetical protein
MRLSVAEIGRAAFVQGSRNNDLRVDGASSINIRIE